MRALMTVIAALAFGVPAPVFAQAQETTDYGQPSEYSEPVESYSQDEIVDAVSDFFGVTAEAAASAMERVFSDLGRPVGYIAGEEIAGAAGIGLRYGEGYLTLRGLGERQKAYWRGPSIDSMPAAMPAGCSCWSIISMMWTASTSAFRASRARPISSPGLASTISVPTTSPWPPFVRGWSARRGECRLSGLFPPPSLAAFLMQLRAFEADDEAGVDALLKAAFPGPGEARLVTALRAADADTLELVAVDHGSVVGSIMFSPVTARPGSGDDDLFGVGLGPVAVVPEHQARGIGVALIEAGLTYLTTLGVPWCVLLGDPDYYKRFDFVPAATWNWSWAGDPTGSSLPPSRPAR